MKKFHFGSKVNCKPCQLDCKKHLATNEQATFLSQVPAKASDITEVCPSLWCTLPLLSVMSVPCLCLV